MRRGSGKKTLLLLSITSLLLFAAPEEVVAEATFSEQEVKAAMLLKILRFVEWPKDTFTAERPNFVFCAAGSDSVAAALEKLLRTQRIAGRAVEWRTLGGNDLVRESQDCHLLFVPSAQTWALEGLLKSLKGRRILLVGDRPGFLESGGMLNFLLEDQRVRFEVNLDRTKAAGLNLSSKLLALASRVLTDFAPG